MFVYLQFIGEKYLSWDLSWVLTVMFLLLMITSCTYANTAAVHHREFSNVLYVQATTSDCTVQSFVTAAVATKEDAIANLSLLCKRKGPRQPAAHLCRATIQRQTTGDCIIKCLFNTTNKWERPSRNCKRRKRLWQLIQREINQEIEELNSNAQELANLVKTKEKVIADLKKSLVMAKTHRLAMQEEIPSLQATNAVAVDEEPGKQKAHCASTHSLESIHECYSRVLAILLHPTPSPTQ